MNRLKGPQFLQGPLPSLPPGPYQQVLFLGPGNGLGIRELEGEGEVWMVWG